MTRRYYRGYRSLFSYSLPLLLLFSFTAFPAHAAPPPHCQETLLEVRSQLLTLRQLSIEQEQELTSSRLQLEKLKTDNAELQQQLTSLSSSLTAAQNDLVKAKQQKRTAVILGISIGAAVVIASSVGIALIINKN